ncbi:MAG: hypothetical protein GWN84_17755 [Gammaproteobacteria bacterium]|nr:hypothetical protein [Gammaproteobacteria bacterium]NIR88946.1 hypothetical protein [Gammaproteobacteria bacterium]NIU05235.1 hypothetical protein [Gammaproteobacteria bacterium]NIV52850.1 hypothetical protein [Gammaproteobacteria bacterium]NIW85146.1 hypothetical protein [Gammaproteobacteria bacterium]
MDLLVSHPWGRFSLARRETIGVLKRFGDPEPKVERTSVAGIAVAHTTLNNREVIRKCRELSKKEPAFEFAVKWVPADYWSETSLEAIRQVIDEKIREHITKDETWAMRVKKRRWQQYHTLEIIEYLAADIERKVDLRHPDKIVRVDVLGNKTAISLLKPDETFSVALSA